jgi:hypothetical protein
VLATFDKQAWLYQYGGQGGLTCTINADGSVSFVGDNGVIVPLPAESVDEAVGALSPYIASASNYYDRTTVVGPNGPEQYVIFGGAKFWIPNPDVATSLKLDLSQTQAISQSALSSIPVIPLDGTLLRELSSAPVYLIRQSQKAHILSSASVDTNGGWSNVRVVPDGALNIIPAGADIA